MPALLTSTSMKPFSRSICAAAAEMEDGEVTSHSIGPRTRKPEPGVSEEEGPVLGSRGTSRGSGCLRRGRSGGGPGDRSCGHLSA